MSNNTKKRLLNCYTSDFSMMNAQELKASIKASEGRTIMAENEATKIHDGHEITYSEVARAFGADLIMLNGLDLFDIVIGGLEKNIHDPIKELKKLVGRPIGVNLEPVDNDACMTELRNEISIGRKATKETFERANELSLDFICLTGNPGTGVTNQKIMQSIKLARTHFKGLIIAGKMHGAGVDEEVIDLNIIKPFIDQGADIILLPAVGTIPGITMELVAEAVKIIKKNGALSMSAIGTSQEGSDVSTIREIALMNKMAGVDIQHIGSAGYSGIAPPMNIFEMSRVIRGDRHTIRMIASSINR